MTTENINLKLFNVRFFQSCALCLMACVFLSACSIYRVTSEDTTDEFYPSKTSIAEVVYLESVDRPHSVIGSVRVNAERRQKVSDIIEKMRQEAAVLGGDAITEIQTDATGIWKKLPAQDFLGNGYIRANFSAKVVKFQ